MSNVKLRTDIIEICRLIHDKGWVANHDGNITVRLAEDRFLATPTGISKRLINEDMLIVVNSAGKKVAGSLQPFSEINLHLAIYKNRTDIKAVLHAHPPYATAKACSGKNIISFIPEAMVSIGDQIPLVPLSKPGQEAAQALEKYLDDYDALMLQNHGVISYGDNIEQAYLRMELVEHLAKIENQALAWGGVKPLPEEMIKYLLNARTKAGLGKDGRKKSNPGFIAAFEELQKPVTPMDIARIIAKKAGNIN